MREHLEAGEAVERVDQRLGRERPDAGARVRAQRADREEAARDRDAECAARIARDDRPGHERDAIGGAEYSIPAGGGSLVWSTIAFSSD